MLKDFSYVILGMLLWQLATTIVCLVTSDDEYKTAKVGIGVYGLLFEGITHIFKKIMLRHLRKYYSSYRTFHKDKNGKDCGTVELFYATPKMAEKFIFDSSSEYYVVLIDEHPKFNSLPQKSRVYKGQQNVYPWTNFNDLFLKKG